MCTGQAIDAVPLDGLAQAEPLGVIARWPHGTPLAALVSDGPVSPWSRWSFLAAPDSAAPVESIGDPVFSKTVRRGGPAADPDAPPFTSGWIGWLGYDLGRKLQPRAQESAGSAVDDRGWPAVRLFRCSGAYAFDRVQSRWWAAGDVSSLPPVDKVFGASVQNTGVCEIGPVVSGTNKEEFCNGVERALEHIRAGDIYQACLSHRLTASFTGDARALFPKLAAHAAPWFGAYIEEPRTGSGVCSLSPECFLRIDPSAGLVQTRPMKGTCPIQADPALLRESTKERAELDMIVDLLRNDLGRVCKAGSVSVDQDRVLEPHGDADSGVLQGVTTVSGVVEHGVTFGELLASVFPSGSVTGAPKVRAMQVIDAIERVRRGVYCGAIGYIGERGASAFSVAIRTAVLTRAAGDASVWPLVEDAALDYSAGAGIVADSDAHREWSETLDKARGFLTAFGLDGIA